MTIQETQIIVHSFMESFEYKSHYSDKALIINNTKYRIRPDDAYYFDDMIFFVEYENNLRPVESISKYYWLFEKIGIKEQSLPIHLLITINNKKLESKYVIRTESIEILGRNLMKLYPTKFNFKFINKSQISKNRIESEIYNLLKKD